MVLPWLEDDVTTAGEAHAQPLIRHNSVDRQIWEALHALEIEAVPKADRRSRATPQSKSPYRRRMSDLEPNAGF